MENVSPTRSNGKFDRILEIVLSNLNSIGSVWIFVLTSLMNADAFGRKLFHSPIDGVNEIVELSIVGIVFLQLGDATRKGRLPRSDGLFNFIGRRWPNFGRFHGALFDLLVAVVMGLILYGSIPLFIESYQSDFYIGVEGLFTAPVWPIKLIIVIGCAVTLLQFLVFVRRNLTRTKIEPTDASAID